MAMPASTDDPVAAELRRENQQLRDENQHLRDENRHHIQALQTAGQVLWPYRNRTKAASETAPLRPSRTWVR